MDYKYDFIYDIKINGIHFINDNSYWSNSYNTIEIETVITIKQIRNINESMYQYLFFMKDENCNINFSKTLNNKPTVKTLLKKTDYSFSSILKDVTKNIYILDFNKKDSCDVDIKNHLIKITKIIFKRYFGI